MGQDKRWEGKADECVLVHYYYFVPQAWRWSLAIGYQMACVRSAWVLGPFYPLTRHDSVSAGRGEASVERGRVLVLRI